MVMVKKRGEEERKEKRREEGREEIWKLGLW